MKNNQIVFNTHFTNGVGNQIFQYMFGHLVCKKHGYTHSHPALPVLEVKSNVIKRDSTNSKNHLKYAVNGSVPKIAKTLMGVSLPSQSFVDCKGHPEDFTLFTLERNYLQAQFNRIAQTNQKDLVLHLRAGDRLLMKGCFENGNPIPVEEYIEAINQFEFEKLHIVTDMPCFKEITVQELNEMKFHRNVKQQDRINPKIAVKYWNSLVKELSKFDPIVRIGNSVEADFDYISQFDQILFAHGTLAWWAAFLSDASKVGVYGKWRCGKSINLSWANIPGWFQWGPATAPPRHLKEWNILECAKYGNHRVFVETGTRGATTLLTVAPYFQRLYSVEIIEAAYKKALRKVQKFKSKIRLYHGDSANELSKILFRVKEPALFWLDAHDGRNSTPIMQELDLILRSDLKHTLIIDDSRYFGTEKAYPNIEEVAKKVKELAPHAMMDVEFDSIRIFM